MMMITLTVILGKILREYTERSRVHCSSPASRDEHDLPQSVSSVVTLDCSSLHVSPLNPSQQTHA